MTVPTPLLDSIEKDPPVNSTLSLIPERPSPRLWLSFERVPDPRSTKIFLQFNPTTSPHGILWKIISSIKRRAEDFGKKRP
jgi:hypothetical protein